MRAPPSFSRFRRQRLMRFPICSSASLPTSVLDSRMSKSHDLVEAVTASLIDNLSDGKDDTRWR